MAKQCTFNKQWLDYKLNPEFASWLDLVSGDSSLAYCKVCMKSFKLSNMGRQSVLSHAKGPKHVKNAQSTCLQPKISFFTKSVRTEQCAVPSFPSCSSHASNPSSTSDSSCSSSLTPVLQQTNVKTFTVNDDDVTSAEIMWALEVVSGKMSLNACDRSASVFRRMFHDSKIAQNFSMKKTKASYVINHGLAPYFKDCLKSDLNNCSDYVVCFDESLNKVVQRGQMDIFVRFWDVNQQRVCTRYWNSVFLGRATAVHLLAGFSEGLMLPLENLLQVSMDGPNVNHSFYKKLESKLKDDNPDGKSHLDIGTCDYTVNGAVKTGHQTAGWDVNSVLRAMYGLFKDSPARRAKYIDITQNKDFPFKFTSVRWLENGACVERALKIYDNVQKFLEEESLPGNDNYKCLKEAMAYPLLKVRMTAFKSLISECEPFLVRFQSQKPLVPFLYTALQELVRNLLMRFVKQEVIAEACTAYKLMTLDLSDNENLIPIEKVDVGYAAKKMLKEVKCSDKKKLMFKNEFQKFLVSIVEKLKLKSPLKSHLVRGLTCFDPKVIFFQSGLGLKRVDTVLEELHGAKRISEKLADRAKKQYVTLTAEAQSETWKKSFTDFATHNNDTLGLDQFFHSHIGNDKRYEDLWQVMELCFILSLGNASLKSGFSINKSLLVENLLEESLVAQRIICDAVKNMGGTQEVTITRSMLVSVRASRRRYQAYLENKNELNAEEEKQRQGKRKIEQQLRELEEKKKIKIGERNKTSKLNARKNFFRI